MVIKILIKFPSKLLLVLLYDFNISILLYFTYATLSWYLYLYNICILLPNGVLLFVNGEQRTNTSKRFCQHKNNNHFDANKKIIIIKNKCRKMFFVRLKSKSLVLPARISSTTSVEIFPPLLIFPFSFLFFFCIFKKKLHSQITFFSVCSCTTLIFVISK